MSSEGQKTSANPPDGGAPMVGGQASTHATGTTTPHTRPPHTAPPHTAPPTRPPTGDLTPSNDPSPPLHDPSLQPSAPMDEPTITPASTTQLELANDPSAPVPTTTATGAGAAPTPIVQRLKWAMCDACNKWRMIPGYIDEDSLPNDWTCRDNQWDPLHNTCDAPEQAEDDPDLVPYAGLVAGSTDVPPVGGHPVDAYHPRPPGEGRGMNGEDPSAAAPATASTGTAAATGGLGTTTTANHTNHINNTMTTTTKKKAKAPRRASKLSARGPKAARGGRGGGVGVPPAHGGSGGEADVGGLLDILSAAEQLTGGGVAGVSGYDHHGHGRHHHHHRNHHGGSKSPPPVPPEIRAMCRTGRLVWGKVAGYDWWPAKVIRRRAVPDMAAPPGAPEHLHARFPVIFFSPRGLPGDPMGWYPSNHIPMEGGDDLVLPRDPEAEYAWLDARSVRPFLLDEHHPTKDRLLASSIQAARRHANLYQVEEQHMSTWDLVEDGLRRNVSDDSDSDGGWGGTVAHLGGVAGAGGGRSRGGRGGGGRVVGGSEGSAALAVRAGGVEAVLGWRPPRGGPGSSPSSTADPGTSHAAGHGSGCGGRGSREREFLLQWRGKSHIHSEWLSEGEAGALAPQLLTRFWARYGHEPVCLQEPQWVIPERMVSRRPAVGRPGWEVLVLWTGLGYDRCTWEHESERFFRLEPFLELMDDLWNEQLRVVGLAGRLMTPLTPQPFVSDLDLSTATTAEAENGGTGTGTGTDGTSVSTPISSTISPPLVASVQLRDDLTPRQRVLAHNLSAHFSRGASVLVADPAGVGKEAAAAAFVLSARADFGPRNRPTLIVCSKQSTDWWAAEVSHAAVRARSADAVGTPIVYQGNTTSRHVLWEYEIWMPPAAADGRPPLRARPRGVTAPLIKASVIIVDYQTLALDIELFTQLEYDVVLVEASPLLGARVHEMISHATTLDVEAEAWAALAPALAPKQLKSHQRVLVVGCPDDPRAWGAETPAAVAARTFFGLAPGDALPVVREHRPTDPRPTDDDPAGEVMELLVPIPSAPYQLEAYRERLLRAYPLLVQTQTSTSTAEGLRELLVDLLKVCSHPFALPDATPQRVLTHPGDVFTEHRELTCVAPAVQAAGGAEALLLSMTTLGKLDYLTQVVRAVATGTAGGKSDGTDPSVVVVVSRYDTTLRAAQHALIHRLVVADKHTLHLTSDATTEEVREGLKVLLVPKAEEFSTSASETAAEGGDYKSNEATNYLRVLLVHARTVGFALDLSEAPVAVVVVLDPDVPTTRDVGTIARMPCFTKRGVDHHHRKKHGLSAGTNAASRVSACPPILHLVSAGTVEEEVFCAESKGVPLASALHGLATEQVARDVTVLEKVVRFGATDIFGTPTTATTNTVTTVDGEEDAGTGKEKEGATATLPARVPSPTSTRTATPTTMATSTTPLLPPLAWARPDTSWSGLTDVFAGTLLATLALPTGSRVRTLPATLVARARQGADIVPSPSAHEPVKTDDGDVCPGEANGVLPETTTNTTAAAAATAATADLNATGTGTDHHTPSPVTSSFWLSLLQEKYTVWAQADAALHPPQESNSDPTAPMTTTTGYDADDGRMKSTDGRGGGRRTHEDTMEGAHDDPALHPVGPKKKRKGTGGNAHHHATLATNRYAQDAALAEFDAERQWFLSEMTRRDQMLVNLRDRATPEGQVALRAYQRLAQAVAELGLDGDTLTIAHQASEVLLLMRPENEPPSDFQGYTMVSLVAVAAHLRQVPLGDRCGIPRLAEVYGHDAQALEQVFQHILYMLAYYRSLQIKRHVLMDEEAFERTRALREANGADGGNHKQNTQQHHTSKGAGTGHAAANASQGTTTGGDSSLEIQTLATNLLRIANQPVDVTAPSGVGANPTEARTAVQQCMSQVEDLLKQRVAAMQVEFQRCTQDLYVVMNKHWMEAFQVVNNNFEQTYRNLQTSNQALEQHIRDAQHQQQQQQQQLQHQQQHQQHQQHQQQQQAVSGAGAGGAVAEASDVPAQTFNPTQAPSAPAPSPVSTSADKAFPGVGNLPESLAATQQQMHQGMNVGEVSGGGAEAPGRGEAKLCLSSQQEGQMVKEMDSVMQTDGPTTACLDTGVDNGKEGPAPITRDQVTPITTTVTAPTATTTTPGMETTLEPTAPAPAPATEPATEPTDPPATVSMLSIHPDLLASVGPGNETDTGNGNGSMSDRGGATTATTNNTKTKPGIKIKLGGISRQKAKGITTITPEKPEDPNADPA